MIVAHSHPSGDATPTIDDIDVTRRLRATGELLCIPSSITLSWVMDVVTPSRKRTDVAAEHHYFAFAWAFRRSAQYRVILSDTAFRAATDIFRVVLDALRRALHHAKTTRRGREFCERSFNRCDLDTEPLQSHLRTHPRELTHSPDYPTPSSWPSGSQR